ncbi:MAG: phosphotransferase [Pelagimonas sp.]|jgi:aminoglycoside phosphotransferase (APT) family kinase protein|nr:phosphotransferase [Pelagimonas sp.]
MGDIFDDPLFYEKVRGLSGASVRDVQFPAGKSRSTIRVILEDDRILYATRRKQKARATRELQILWALGRANVPAPQLIGVEDSFFLQQDVGGERLTLHLHEVTDRAERQARVQEAADSLLRVSAALDTDDLSPLFVADHKARVSRAKLPGSAARYFGLTPPEIKIDQILDILNQRQDRPIKGDARAANAIRQPDGRIVWLDWDRIDRGSAVDDVVTLLCDEYVDLPFEVLAQMLSQAAARDLPHLSPCAREEYIATSAVLQCLHRLSLIFNTYAEMKGWGRYETCLKYDRVGVSKRCVRRLCDRGSGWAARSSVLAPVQEIFDAIRAA